MTVHSLAVYFVGYGREAVVMTFYDALWYFFIYGFIGWSMEVIYAAACLGKFVNRGFLNGPICPIYGVGVITAVVCLTPVSDRLLLLFILSVVLTSLLELVTGFVLERFFNTKWWDYSDIPFNIGGYICLKFSLLWGFACVFVIKIVHPLISSGVSMVPETVGNVFLSVIGCVFTADIIVTVIGLSELRKKFKKLTYAQKVLRILSDKIGSGLSDETLELIEKNSEFMDILAEKKSDAADIIEKYREYIAKSNFVHRRIFRAFPHVEKKYSLAVSYLAERFPGLMTRVEAAINTVKRVAQIRNDQKKSGEINLKKDETDETCKSIPESDMKRSDDLCGNVMQDDGNSAQDSGNNVQDSGNV